MLKKIFILFLLIVTSNGVIFAYTSYKPAELRYYGNGTYENINKREVKEYRDNYERNKYEINDRTYCYIPEIKGDTTPDWGYFIKRDRHNVIGYRYQESFGRIEKIPCHKTLDHTPVVTTFDEARNYKD